LKWRISAALLLVAVAAFGQSFETAAIKPDNRPDEAGVIKPIPGGLMAQNTSIRSCIQWAWNLRDYQVLIPASLKDAAESARYDITARAEGSASVDQLKLMLQALLKERFHLEVHTEKRDTKVLALVVARGGPKNLHEPAPDEKTYEEPVSTDAEGQHWIFHNCDMKLLAGFLSSAGVVVDMTGIDRRFTFTFVDPVWNKSEGPLADHMLSQVFPELQRQLGLRVQGQTVPTDVIVVDRVDKSPVEN
jgi:uncharacterized protein (TIGR03435 family)